MAVTLLLEEMQRLNGKTMEENKFLYLDFSVSFDKSEIKKPNFILQLIFSPLEGRVRVGARVRMDGPMAEKFASPTNPSALIDEILTSEAAITFDAHKSVCPIISGDQRSEEVESLLKLNEDLINIFREKMKGIESLRRLDFDALLTKLSRQTDMSIINSIADYIGLGIPKICQASLISI